MTPFDRAEAAWESSWIGGPGWDCEPDEEEEDPNPKIPASEAGEEHEDGIPF